jgi:MarR family transcriptional regulator for hemolysin
MAYCAYYKLAYYYLLQTEKQAMPSQPVKREFAFTIMDVARLLKTYADQRARQFGISRAQWAVLIRIDRHEGLKQTELADMLDLQPITLTRLLDRLSDNGLIERRADPNDRRANRLYLKPAAKPLLDRLADLGADMMETVLDGVSMTSVERMLKELGAVKDNLRAAIARNSNQQQAIAG